MCLTSQSEELRTKEGRRAKREQRDADMANVSISHDRMAVMVSRTYNDPERDNSLVQQRPSAF